ncbi:MAG: cobaltochelatase subunit CobS [Rickettsiaceae bacterium]|jgi:cobaltochelatase CobS|nr:cobaltochelatase subunit CobS [Rickettsiaceae bacterium]
MLTIDTLKLFGFDPGFEVKGIIEKSSLVPEIDNYYRFDPTVTKAILAGFAFNKKVMITGLHGTGKSTHIEQVAARLNWPALRINLDGYITRIELIGRDTITIKDGVQVTEFFEGMLPWAARNGIALILDEYDAARPEVLFVLQQLLEKSGKLSLIENNINITPHEHFRLFATSNTTGSGDDVGIYQGTQYLNQGQLDRWSIVTKLDYIKPEEESAMIIAKVEGIDQETAAKMVDFAALSRDGFKVGSVSQLMSPRTVLSWAENYIIFKSLKEALYFSFVNRCSVEDKEVFSEYYQRVFDNEL